MTALSMALYTFVSEDSDEIRLDSRCQFQHPDWQQWLDVIPDLEELVVSVVSGAPIGYSIWLVKSRG